MIRRYQHIAHISVIIFLIIAALAPILSYVVSDQVILYTIVITLFSTLIAIATSSIKLKKETFVIIFDKVYSSVELLIMIIGSIIAYFAAKDIFEVWCIFSILDLITFISNFKKGKNSWLLQILFYKSPCLS